MNEKPKTEIERYVSPVQSSEDMEDREGRRHNIIHIRPEKFVDYPGQQKVKDNLEVYVAASKKRDQPLDHVLLHGPPGLGKTTLAHIIAKELGVPFVNVSAPSIEKPGDLAGIIAGLEEGTLLFIDEIHRLTIQVEEILYSAMEDFYLDIVLGQGPTARSTRVDVAPFTLVGATTKVSSLSRPLLSRFGIQERLEFYDVESLEKIIERSAALLSIKTDGYGAKELAKRSRGTPRIANRLLRRVWDFAIVAGDNVVNKDSVEDALMRLEIDSEGLDRTDREILLTILNRYEERPVGIETLAVTMGEERSTLEDVYEPFLVYRGFLSRTPRGRVLTPKGRKHIESILM